MLRPLKLACCLLLAGCGWGRVDELVEQLGSEDVATRRLAARQLGDLQQQAAPAASALQQHVGDPDADVRRLSCYALGEIGPEAREARPVLTLALEDDELPVRLAAAFALQKTAPGDEPSAGVLADAMRAGDGGIIVEVGRMGSQAAWAVPTLVDLLQDRRPGIRRLAAEALGRIGPPAASAGEALERAEQDSDDRVRASASAALKAIAQGREGASPP